jgi:pyroglutamyl-peptidase
VKILLTGFNAFGSLRRNPSEQIVQKWAQNKPAHISSELICEVLPTEYTATTRRLRSLIRKHRPDVILCLGVAVSRNVLSLERLTVNLDDDLHADNAGVVRKAKKIVLRGPAAYWSTLPLDTMHAALRRRRIPVQYSNTAGTYLCNHAFYIARHEIEQESQPIPCGFIHLPREVRQQRRPVRGFTLDQMMRTVICCLEICEKKPHRRKSV